MNRTIDNPRKEPETHEQKSALPRNGRPQRFEALGKRRKKVPSPSRRLPAGKKPFGSRWSVVGSGKNVRLGSWHQTPATKAWSAHSAKEPAAEWISCPSSLRPAHRLKAKRKERTAGKFYRARRRAIAALFGEGSPGSRSRFWAKARSTLLSFEAR